MTDTPTDLPTASLPSSGSGAVRPVMIGARALRALRGALEREAGSQAASLLQEVGFSGGESLHAGFVAHLRDTYQVERPDDLDVEYLGDALSSYFTRTGWGHVAMERLGDAVFTLDSTDWAEASDGGAQYPSCHFTTGALADLFTRIGNLQTAVLEVECRSRGDARCRFLVGSPETLSSVYERMAAGLSYQQALGL